MLHEGMRALYDEGDLVAARRAFDAAYRAAERAGDGAAMGQAALGMGGLWLPVRSGTPEAVLVRMRLRHALATVDRPAVVARRMRTRLAAESDHGTGDHAAVLGQLAEARRHHNPVAHAEAAALARNCVAGPSHRALRVALTGELTEQAAHSGRRSDQLVGLLWHTVDLFLDADPRAASSLADLRAALAERQHGAIDAAAQLIGGMCRLRAGDLDRAEAEAEATAGRGLAAGDPDAAQWHLMQMVAIRWFQGRIADLRPVLREWVDPAAPGFAGQVGRAVLVLAGDGEAPGGWLSGADLAALPHTSTWLTRMCTIVECAHLTGDAELAASAYDLLMPYADRPMLAGPAVACFGSAQQALGVAALATGRVDRAVHHLREAVHANTRLGHRPAATLSRWRLSQALARRGEHARAEAERAAAAGEAGTMGMILPPERHRRTGPVTLAGHVPMRPPVRCRRVGQLWEFAVGPRQVRVPERRGVVYLAMLCASPGQEIRAAELVGGLGLVDVAGPPQPVLDDAARRDYRRRLAALRQQSDEAGAEHEWLRAELAATTGLGGRPRSFGNADERARISVGKAIRRAVDQIEQADPLVGGRLRDGVRTGVRCSYRD